MDMNEESSGGTQQGIPSLSPRSKNDNVGITYGLEAKSKKRDIAKRFQERKLKPKKEKKKLREATSMDSGSSSDDEPTKMKKRVGVIEKLRRFGSKEELGDPSSDQGKKKKNKKKDKRHRTGEDYKSDEGRRSSHEVLDPVPSDPKDHNKKPKSRGDDTSSDEEEEEEFAKQLLTYANRYRNIHGARRLKANKELNSMAREYARMLEREQEIQDRRNQKYGKNKFSKVVGSPQDKVTGKEVIETWYQELDTYSFGEEPQSSHCSKNATQLLWKSSRDIGIARTRANSKNVVFVAAYFSPRGNIAGEYKAQVSPLEGFQTQKSSLDRSSSSDVEQLHDNSQEKVQDKSGKKNFLSTMFHKIKKPSDGNAEPPKKKEKKAHQGYLGNRRGKYVLNDGSPVPPSGKEQQQGMSNFYVSVKHGSPPEREFVSDEAAIEKMGIMADPSTVKLSKIQRNKSGSCSSSSSSSSSENDEKEPENTFTEAVLGMLPNQNLKPEDNTAPSIPVIVTTQHVESSTRAKGQSHLSSSSEDENNFDDRTKPDLNVKVDLVHVGGPEQSAVLKQSAGKEKAPEEKGEFLHDLKERVNKLHFDSTSSEDEDKTKCRIEPLPYKLKTDSQRVLTGSPMEKEPSQKTARETDNSDDSSSDEGGVRHSSSNAIERAKTEVSLETKTDKAPKAPSTEDLNAREELQKASLLEEIKFKFRKSGSDSSSSDEDNDDLRKDSGENNRSPDISIPVVTSQVEIKTPKENHSSSEGEVKGSVEESTNTSPQDLKPGDKTQKVGLLSKIKGQIHSMFDDGSSSCDEDNAPKALKKRLSKESLETNDHKIIIERQRADSSSSVEENSRKHSSDECKPNKKSHKIGLLDKIKGQFYKKGDGDSNSKKNIPELVIPQIIIDEPKKDSSSSEDEEKSSRNETEISKDISSSEEKSETMSTKNSGESTSGNETFQDALQNTRDDSAPCIEKKEFKTKGSDTSDSDLENPKLKPLARLKYAMVPESIVEKGRKDSSSSNEQIPATVEAQDAVNKVEHGHKIPAVDDSSSNESSSDGGKDESSRGISKRSLKTLSKDDSSSDDDIQEGEHSGKEPEDVPQHLTNDEAKRGGVLDRIKGRFITKSASVDNDYDSSSSDDSIAIIKPRNFDKRPSIDVMDEKKLHFYIGKSHDSSSSDDEDKIAIPLGKDTKENLSHSSKSNEFLNVEMERKKSSSTTEEDHTNSCSSDEDIPVIVSPKREDESSKIKVDEMMPQNVCNKPHSLSSNDDDDVISCDKGHVQKKAAHHLESDSSSEDENVNTTRPVDSKMRSPECIIAITKPQSSMDIPLGNSSQSDDETVTPSKPQKAGLLSDIKLKFKEKSVDKSSSDGSSCDEDTDGKVQRDPEGGDSKDSIDVMLPPISIAVYRHDDESNCDNTRAKSPINELSETSSQTNANSQKRGLFGKIKGQFKNKARDSDSSDSSFSDEDISDTKHKEINVEVKCSSKPNKSIETISPDSTQNKESKGEGGELENPKGGNISDSSSSSKENHTIKQGHSKKEYEETSDQIVYRVLINKTREDSSSDDDKTAEPTKESSGNLSDNSRTIDNPQSAGLLSKIKEKIIKKQVSMDESSSDDENVSSEQRDPTITLPYNLKTQSSAPNLLYKSSSSDDKKNPLIVSDKKLRDSSSSDDDHRRQEERSGKELVKQQSFDDDTTTSSTGKANEPSKPKETGGLVYKMKRQLQKQADGFESSSSSDEGGKDSRKSQAEFPAPANISIPGCLSSEKSRLLEKHEDSFDTENHKEIRDSSQNPSNKSAIDVVSFQASIEPLSNDNSSEISENTRKGEDLGKIKSPYSRSSSEEDDGDIIEKHSCESSEKLPRESNVQVPKEKPFENESSDDETKPQKEGLLGKMKGFLSKKDDSSSSSDEDIRVALKPKVPEKPRGDHSISQEPQQRDAIAKDSTKSEHIREKANMPEGETIPSVFVDGKQNPRLVEETETHGDTKSTIPLIKWQKYEGNYAAKCGNGGSSSSSDDEDNRLKVDVDRRRSSTHVTQLKQLFENTNTKAPRYDFTNKKELETISLSGEHLKEKFIQQILKSINKYRRKHSADELILNDQLCDLADERGNSFAVGVTGNINCNLGENIFVLPSAEYNLKDSAKHVVNSWYQRISFHKFDSEPTELSSKAGPFTQMVWRSSKELGVGLHTNIRDNKVIVVGIFCPAGNIQGQFRDQVLHAKEANEKTSELSSEDTSSAQVPPSCDSDSESKVTP